MQQFTLSQSDINGKRSKPKPRREREPKWEFNHTVHPASLGKLSLPDYVDMYLTAYDAYANAAFGSVDELFYSEHVAYLAWHISRHPEFPNAKEEWKKLIDPKCQITRHNTLRRTRGLKNLKLQSAKH